MRTEFKREKSALQLVITPTNEQERVLLSEFVQERKESHQGRVTLHIQDNLSDRVSRNVVISQKNYLNRDVMYLYGFKHLNKGGFYKHVKFKTLIAFGVGTMMVWEINFYKSIRECRLEYLHGVLYISRDGDVLYDLRRPESIAKIQTSDELVDLLKEYK